MLDTTTPEPQGEPAAPAVAADTPAPASQPAEPAPPKREMTRGEVEAAETAARRKRLDAVYDRSMKRVEAEKAERTGFLNQAAKDAADRAAETSRARSEPTRAADGKFTKAETDGKPAPAADAAPGHNNPPKATSTEATPKADAGQPAKAAEATPVAQPAAPPPQSWPAAMKEKWSTLEPTVQSYLAQRDRDVARDFTRVGQTLKAAKPLFDTVESFRDTFAGWQLEPHEAIRNLVQRAQTIDRDPMAGIAALARDYGIDLAQYAAQTIDPSQLPPDPRLTEAQARISALERQLHQSSNQIKARDEAFRQMMEEAERADATARYQTRTTESSKSLDAFVKDRPDFEEYEETIADLIGVLRAANPGMTGEQALSKAYDVARRLDPDYEKSINAQAQKRYEAKRAAEAAAHASSVAVNGLPNADRALSKAQRRAELWAAAHKRHGLTPTAV
jgi:hypothetical protein